MAPCHTVDDVVDWARELDVVAERLASHFTRREPRHRAIQSIRGLRENVERKNAWQLAPRLGDATPDGVQHLQARAESDADAGRDDLTRSVAEHLGTPAGVLIVDETGFLQKGTKSCGVARPDSGTAGRIENGQIGVFLADVSPRGRALIDRELYVPREWASDVERRTAAKVPEDVEFATQIISARDLIARAVAAGVPTTWVTADAVSGSDDPFRKNVEDLGLGDVVGVRSDFTVWVGFPQVRAKALLAHVPADA